VAGPGAASDPEEGLEGLQIVRIVFCRSDIFDTSDPRTSAWFYRWANALHIVSKEGFLRQMILLREGEPYSSDQAAESARILRGLGFINPVHITARRVDGGVEVTISTHDRWTLELAGDLGLTGSRSEFAVEIEEENLLGWGKNLEVEYQSDVERDTVRYRYGDPNVFGSRWQLELTHEDASDGSLNRVRTGRPFYALATRRAWGGTWQESDLTRHLYSESESVVSGREESDTWNAFYGMALSAGDDITRRLSVGWSYRHDRFLDWTREADGRPYPTPEDRLVSGPRVEYEQVPDRFLVLMGYRAWVSQEDVGLGPTFRLGATLSLPSLGGDIERLLIDGDISAAHRRGRWILTGDAFLSGRFDEGDPRDWVFGVQATASQLGTRGWQLRVFAQASHELDLDRQLTLGADSGLRGWDPDSFDGTGRAVANVQWRTLLKKDLFQLFTVGLEAFLDAGVTWDARVGRDTDGVRIAAGLGLLFDLTTIGRDSLLRIDVGIPDDGSGYTLIVASSALF
jgi:hypothetical protein